MKYMLRTGRLRLTLALLFAWMVCAVAPAFAESEISVAPASFLWDPSPMGTTRLVRTDSGLHATFLATDLPAGQAITMWFIVFNNPGACTANPCSIEDLLFNVAAEGDFLWGAGKIVGASGQGGFGGHLKAGDLSRSAFTEIGFPAERRVGLTNPWGAEVQLALHTHGPAQTGQALKSQLSSFTGGCFNGFLGNAFGQAQGPADIPAATGFCTTFAASVHQ